MTIDLMEWAKFIGTWALLIIPVVLLYVAIQLRRVVPTNEVHIVQSAKKTTSYGKDTSNGNTYYEWPSWIPMLGVTRITLPVSVFDIDLAGYEAYDKDRVPFIVDVKGFFRISDSNMAAQRVSSFEELINQLRAITQGAVRVVLAGSDLESIMQGRATYGEAFTKEVNGQLTNWGVETVKNIELMDIRDGKGSQVIHNIMAKKMSHIEMESRTEVAKNRKVAEVAEIEAKKEVDLQAQSAAQAVGTRKAQTEREVLLAQQEKVQAVASQEKVTKEKEMDVIQVQILRKAEIDRQESLVRADQQKQTTVIAADAKLEQQKREAEGVKADGDARASAEKAMQMAPVEAQLKLAEGIGSNKSYQDYLIASRKVEAEQAIGIEQAKALEKAEIKIIANTGNAPTGLKSVTDVFSSHGGTQLGAMLEGLAATEAGKALVQKVVSDARH